MAAPPSTRTRFTPVAAGLALVLAAVALVVSLTRDQTPAPARAVTTAARPQPPAPDSLTGAQIDESSLGPVPRSKQADRANDARRLAGRGPSAFAPAGSVAATRVLHLSTGQTKTLLRRAPFTIRARCTTSAKGAISVLLTAKSDQGSSVIGVAGRSLAPFGGGTSRGFLALVSPKYFWLSGQPFMISAPSGPSLGGLAAAGVKAFGSDCAASVVAVG